MIRYTKLPTLHQWKKKDSFVRDFRVIRNRDKVLAGIDSILDALHQCHQNGMRNYLIIELYFATNFWLRNLNNQFSNMHPGREDAVRALCRYAIEQMATGFGCGIQAVPTKLEQYYGRSMTDHGRSMDAKNPGHYMTRAEVEQYKLLFKGGVAYCFDWKNKRVGQDFVLAIADTEDIHIKDTDQSTLTQDYARFAMSMSRDIYLAPHVSYGAAAQGRTVGRIAPAVHSSYLAGSSVLCAGSICIINGHVTAIKADSGHYQPQYQQLMNLVNHLGLVGLNLDKVEILDYLGWPLGSATEFQANNLHWRKRIDETGLRYRQTRDVDKMVEDRIANLEKKLYFEREGRPRPKDQTMWNIAYRSICEDLAVALNDPTWRTHAELGKAMPRRAAPKRPAPPRPSTPHPRRTARV